MEFLFFLGAILAAMILKAIVFGLWTNFRIHVLGWMPAIYDDEIALAIYKEFAAANVEGGFGMTPEDFAELSAEEKQQRAAIIEGCALVILKNYALRMHTS